MPLDLGLSTKDLSWEDLARLGIRRLAQLEAQLTRIADALELQLKLQAVKANLTLTQIREAAEDTQPLPDQLPVEVLTQTEKELAELEGVFTRAATRLGAEKALALDLYAERAKEAPDNLEEEP